MAKKIVSKPKTIPSIVDPDDVVEKYVAPPKVLNQKTDDETIVSYLIENDGNVSISAALREKLKRYEFCSDELRKNPSWFFVAKRMMEKYGLSENQAFRDVESTTRIYNTISRKQYIGRDFHISNLLSDVMKLYNKCIKSKDFKTAEKILRNRSNILSTFYGGFEAGLYQDLQLPNIKIGFFPELTNVEVPEDWKEIIERSIAKKKKKALFLDDAEDAEIIPLDE